MNKSSSDALLSKTIALKNFPLELLLLNNNSLLAIGFVSPEIEIWNANTSLKVQALTGHTNQVRALALVSQTNESVLASGSYDCCIKIWNPQNGRLLMNLTGHRDEIVDLGSLTNGHLVSCSRDKTLKIWNIKKDGRPLKSLYSPRSEFISCFKIIKSDMLVMSAHLSKTILFFNLTSGREIKSITGQNEHILCLLVLRQEDTIASGESDYLIKIWNITTCLLRMSLRGHTQALHSIVNLKNDHLASASRDKTIKIWNHQNGLLLETLRDHSNTVFDLALLISDGDNASLASVSADRTLKIWNLSDVFKYPNKTNMTEYGKSLFTLNMQTTLLRKFRGIRRGI
jgi:WD40 repeat protein